jgi:RimJ/RimL family protein N-acetyltransferase
MSEGPGNCDVPVLETSRLILRELGESDLDDYAHICADPEVMRYVGGKPLTRSEAWRSLAFFLGHWRLRGYGMWAVVNRETGRFIGRIGFHRPEGWPGFEIGWLIGRDSWGQGLATEGARAVLNLAVPRYGQTHVISLIQPENSASIRVAEKIGECREGETDLNGVRVLIYGVELG